MTRNFVNGNNAVRPGDDTYAEVIKGIQDGKICPFCPEHLHEIHPNPILDETENWVVTENAFPYQNASEHLLFVHKAHIETLGEMSLEAWAELQLAVTGITRAREIEGATLFMRFGDTRFTGATVNHLHAQLVSGSGLGDTGKIVTARVG